MLFKTACFVLQIRRNWFAILPNLVSNFAHFAVPRHSLTAKIRNIFKNVQWKSGKLLPLMCGFSKPKSVQELMIDWGLKMSGSNTMNKDLSTMWDNGRLVLRIKRKGVRESLQTP